jgi:hypothetical protein
MAAIRSMVVFRLCVMPEEYESDAEDLDEWFASLGEAKARREELIAFDPQLDGHRTGEDFAIERVTLPPFSRRTLALSILNRKGFVGGRSVVVKPYKRPEPIDDD